MNQFKHRPLFSYIEGQKNSGIEVGDCVRIIREACDFEHGWDNSWVEDMTSHVGEIQEVVHIYNKSGIELDDGYNYPFFVLEKVEAEDNDVEEEYNE